MVSRTVLSLTLDSGGSGVVEDMAGQIANDTQVTGRNQDEEKLNV